MTVEDRGTATEPSADVHEEPDEQSPFRPTRITEGYPYDEADEAVIERVLSAVREREAQSNGSRPGSQEGS